MTPIARRLLPLFLPLPVLASPLALHNPAAIPDALTAGVAIQAFAGNDALPLKELDGEWAQYPRTLHGKAEAVGSARADLTVSHHDWQVGLFSRAEAWASANRDALDLVYQDKNDIKPEAGRRYQADYRLETFTASGLQLGKQLALINSDHFKLRAGAAASLLQGHQMREDSVQGDANALSDQQYRINAQRTLRYTGLNTRNGFNSFLGDASPEAQGYALDLALAWQWQDNWQGRIVVNDALGQLKWKDLPTSKLEGDTNVDLDANGNREPIISGQDSRTNYTQKLHSKTELAASYQQESWGYEASVTRYRNITLPQLVIRYQLSESWQLRANYETRFASAGLELRHRYFQIGLQSDGRSLASSRTFGLSAGIYLPF